MSGVPASAPPGWTGKLADLLDPPPQTPSWEPQPKQQIAIDLAQEAEELLYGGAAGGGKTEWLINYVGDLMEQHPGNRGVIFRRVFPSLNRSVVPRARQIFHGRARWRGDDKTFSFPNGSVLELASLQYAGDVHDHQGAEYGVVAFEEITEFLQSQYEFLLGRLRAPAPGIRPHAVSTTNPGGVGHAWVKQRFIRPKEEDYTGEHAPVPMEIWTPAPTPEKPHPGTRVFVPSTLEDNPALLARDPEYLERLRAAISDRGLRQALVSGDWDAIDAVEGALWKRSWFDEGRSDPKPFEVLRRVVAVDPSDGEETGDGYGVWVGFMCADGAVYTEHSFEWYGTPAELARKTLELARDTFADVIVVERNHGGKWLKSAFLSADRYANVETVWASQGKKARAEPVAALFQPDEQRTPVIAARLIGHHEELEEECTTFTGSVGDESPNRLDAMVWGHAYLALGMKHVETGQADDQRLRGRR